MGETAMSESLLLQNVLTLGGLLFAIGLAGFLIRRNLIVVFLSSEIMLQGVALSLVAWSRYHQDWGGQVFVLLIVAVAACEAALALALVLMLYEQSATLDVLRWQDLREEGQPPIVDRQVPEVTVEEPQWPKLPPAGVEPQWDEDELVHRSRV
jgi:NADH-quinone oxidoreductase subunit K